MTLDAGGRGAAADGVIDATDGTPATRRVEFRLLSRAVAAAAVTTAGFELGFAGAEPDPGREEATPRCRAAVPEVSGVARMPARPADPDEPLVVLDCGPPELLTAVSPGGFSGRR